MKNRGELALGLVLILLGGWFIVQNQFPQVNTWMNTYLAWPLNVVAVGGVIFALGLLFWQPGFSIPAAIVAGVGGILYYQLKFDPAAWSYMWPLIFGFVGIGNIVAGLMSRDRHQAGSGVNLIFISAVLFAIFASLMGKLEQFGLYGDYIPAAILIALGLWVLGRGFFKKGASQ